VSVFTGVHQAALIILGPRPPARTRTTQPAVNGCEINATFQHIRGPGEIAK
jgi:hypothetical protein